MTTKTRTPRKINRWASFADGYFWKMIERNSEVTEKQVAEACGWKDARNVQFGNIFGRLKDMGESKLYVALQSAIKAANDSITD